MKNFKKSVEQIENMQDTVIIVIIGRAIAAVLGMRANVKFVKIGEQRYRKLLTQLHKLFHSTTLGPANISNTN